uniref:uncharacterized protein LOC120335069 n=1 Tax=Styela clava TaxID=7725 RepID=UPI00193A6136|nr:uncharacterized protein LOC120335069 [Styela clava]
MLVLASQGGGRQFLGEISNMAGDFEIEPTLQQACINAIADKIDVYIQKYPPKIAPSNSPSPDRGVSGSVMTDTLTSSSDGPMECETPCLPSEDSQEKGDFCGIETETNFKMLENIASLEMKCCHDPPCGTKKISSCQEPEIFIPNPMSEELLKSVCKKGRLNDSAAVFFADNEKFRIQRMYLKKAGHIQANGLKQLLNNHVLHELNAADINQVRENSPYEHEGDRVRITVGDIVSGLNSATKEKLMSLNVSGIPSEKEDLMPLAIYVTVSQFKKLSVLTNIRHLNVSYTNFTDTDLNTVIACMKHLQSLDISKTYVRSILYLGDMHAPKLRFLNMSNLDKLNMPKERDDSSLLVSECPLRSLLLLSDRGNLALRKFP